MKQVLCLVHILCYENRQRNMLARSLQHFSIVCGIVSDLLVFLRFFEFFTKITWHFPDIFAIYFDIQRVQVMVCDSLE
jgi:hypothetical protein